MNNEVINLLLKSAPLLWQGTIQTLMLSFYSIGIGMVAGTAVGIAMCRRIRIPLLSQVLEVYVFAIRGIPYFLQLLITYFVLPAALGINLSPFAAGALSLGICSAAYVGEIVRSGINALPRGQWEAGKALGYSGTQTLQHIVLPQMFGLTIPTFTNELIQVILSTSIISQVGALELTKAGANIIAREMNPMLIYSSIALLYLGITATVMIIGKLLERSLRYDIN